MKRIRVVPVTAALALAGVLRVTPAVAQQPITLEEAVAAALAAGSRVALASADSAAARAEVGIARAWPNPTLAADYTRDPPRYHGELEQPLEYPWVRSPRIRSAEELARAAGLRLALERAAVRRDVVAAYARAAAADATSELAARSAADGAELLRIARARRDAGDTSDLDVALASVTAAGLANAALDDSLAAVEARLDLQALMGRPSAEVSVELADSLALPVPVAVPPASGPPLSVRAAEAEVMGREAEVAMESRSRLAAPALRGGAEGYDPEMATGALWTAGVSLELPLLDLHGGQVALARADLAAARARLAQARIESARALAAADRARASSSTRAERDREVVEDANRIAAMTATAYREGAMSLIDVLEARRDARAALEEYVRAVADAWTAEADYELAGAAGQLPAEEPAVRGDGGRP